jgi:apolipoprotein N-acyltransferase
MVHAFAARLAALTGWRRLAVALVLGAVSVLALPPIHAVPVLFVTLPALLWLLDGAAGRRGAFAVGWAFGLGFFMAGLYWIANALLIDAARFGWMIPFAVGGLSAVLAAYVGLVTLAVHWLDPRRGWPRVMVFAALWTLAEGVRGWAFTGFPWNLMGTVWMPVEPVVQAAAWGGVLGLTLLTVAVAAMPATLGWQSWDGRARDGRAPVAALGVLAVVAVAGMVRLSGGPADVVDGVRLRLVQPNIPQALKWSPERRVENLHRYIGMSRLPTEDGLPPTHVLWGETALPFALDGTQDNVRAAVAEALADGAGENAAVLTGAVRITPPGQTPYQAWNSMVAIDAAGTLRASFDKFHLVPFGEYVPMRGILPIDKITPGATDFSRGAGPATLTLPGLPPVSPLICYEVIFPGAVVDAANRPAWMLNVTNDGWYGVSSGPYQHLAATRLRAVEEGLPLVRVANTGVSAIIDPYGRMVAEVGLDRAGVADGALPVALPPTVFARTGNFLPLGLALVIVVAALAAGHRRSHVFE